MTSGLGQRRPEIVSAQRPRTRDFVARIERAETPGINTLFEGATRVVYDEAFGANVVDVDGNCYVDFTSGFGVLNLGHRHPGVTAATKEQSRRLVHGLADVYSHPSRIELAERIAAVAPVRDARTSFAISGADAVEIALKTASLATGRQGVLCFEPSYHGTTLGALAVSSRTAFHHGSNERWSPFVERLPFGASSREIDAALRRGTIGGCIVEPIVGREGVLPPPEGWLAELFATCREHGVLAIADEVFTGFGRTGRLFALDHDDLAVDVLCCGKALGGGYPIAATLLRSELARAWETPGEALHTATFVAHPVACAAALATLDVLLDERLAERALRLGEVVRQALAPLLDAPTVRGVRGRGLLWGIETHTAEAAKEWSARLHDRGLIVLAGGPRGTVLQLVPPLVIEEDLLQHCLEIVVEVAPRG